MQREMWTDYEHGINAIEIDSAVLHSSMLENLACNHV